LELIATCFEGEADAGTRVALRARAPRIARVMAMGAGVVAMIN